MALHVVRCFISFLYCGNFIEIIIKLSSWKPLRGKNIKIGPKNRDKVQIGESFAFYFIDLCTEWTWSALRTLFQWPLVQSLEVVHVSHSFIYFFFYSLIPNILYFQLLLKCMHKWIQHDCISNSICLCRFIYIYFISLLFFCSGFRYFICLFKIYVHCDLKFNAVFYSPYYE